MKKNELSDSQADAVVITVVILLAVSFAVIWVSGQ